MNFILKLEWDNLVEIYNINLPILFPPSIKKWVIKKISKEIIFYRSRSREAILSSFQNYCKEFINGLLDLKFDYHLSLGAGFFSKKSDT